MKIPNIFLLSLVYPESDPDLDLNLGQKIDSDSDPDSVSDRDTGHSNRNKENRLENLPPESRFHQYYHQYYGRPQTPGQDTLTPPVNKIRHQTSRPHQDTRIRTQQSRGPG